MAKIHELLLPHAPYSPSLAYSDFLLPDLKKWLSGQRFSNNEEVMSAVNGYFEEKDSSYYKKGIKLLEHHWEKCIELKGENVKKFFFIGSGIVYTIIYFFLSCFLFL